MVLLFHLLKTGAIAHSSLSRVLLELRRLLAILAVSLLAGASTAVVASNMLDCSGLYPWNAETAYPGGSRVHHEDMRYQANWWSQGQNPLTHSGPWQEWTSEGRCSSVPEGSDCSQLTQWHAGAIYLGGDEVKHKGKHYRAEWWTQGLDPELASGPGDAWVLLDKCAGTSNGGNAPGGILWIAGSYGVNKLVGGRVEQHLPGPASALAVAPGYVWVYHQRQLRGYRADGTLEAEVTLPQLHPQRVPAGLAADPEGLWLADGRHLYRLGRQGQLLKTVELNQRVTGMVLDNAGQLWLTAANQLLVISGDGQVLEQLPMPASVKSLAYDKERNDVWLSAGPDLLRIDAETHALEFSFRLGPQTHLVAGPGGLWTAHANKLRRVNQVGEVEHTTRVQPPVQGIAVDLETGGIWVAGRDYLHFYNVDGQLQYTHEIEGAIAHIASGDVPPPELVFLAPADGDYINTRNPTVELEYHSKGTIDTDSISLSHEDTALELDCQADQTTADCTVRTELPEGQVTLTATIADTNGQVSEPATVIFTVDTLAPVISLVSPANGLVTNQPLLALNGTVSEPLRLLSLNTGNTSAELTLDGNHAFSHELTLQEGINSVTVIAVDLAGNTGTLDLELVLDTSPPAAPATGKIAIFPPDDQGQVVVTGQAGSVEPGGQVIITNTRTGTSVTATADAEGAFSVTLEGEVGDQITVTVSDAAGNSSDSITVEVNAFPPDPAHIAPPLSETGVTPYSEAVAFLYSGANRVQTGVQPGTIEERRVAVIRGRVLDRQNNPLPGVTITIKNHPELGQTLSRADGWFDLAVNGGGNLTINYQKEGYLPVQRKVNTPWRDYVFAEDVVMIQLDPQVTTVDINSPVMQVARGTPQTDAEGTRQATLLFPSGTTATMTLPDGSTQALTSLSVRATEYTVGDNGFEAMPGELPATVAYTYALELSVDEAMAAGAKRVDFNQPVPFYVDNFLNFPTGEIVPVGWYDREAAVWRASDNGRVVEILRIESGLAVLDVTGTGEAATQAELDELGITQAELQQLAGLYTAGKSLWRTPISHFTPWDCNWPARPPADAELPDVPDPETNDDDEPDDSDEEDECKGCVISPQRQTLGENIPVAGTPFDLIYRSDRVAGYRNNRVRIQLSDGQVPGSLESIALRIEIAGQQYSKKFSAAAGQSYIFEWDGRDGFGRPVTGTRPARISITYYYPCVYTSADPNLPMSWAVVGEPSEPIGTRDNCRLTALERTWSVTLKSPHKAQPMTVGAWSLDVHHVYDPVDRVLYLGNGMHRGYTNPTITTVAGTGRYGLSGDGGPAEEARFYYPEDVAIGPDGSLYIADTYNSRIRRVNTDGTISTVAGIGTAGSGDGSFGYSGDGGLATEARLDHPWGVAVGPDGSIYIADSGNNRVRRVSPDGIITTIAGTGAGRSGPIGDGGLATEASLFSPSKLAIGPDGSLYVVSNGRIRRISPDGVIFTVAGGGHRPVAEGELASNVEFSRGTYGVDVAPDGTLYVTDYFQNYVYQVGSDGILTVVAGTGEGGFSGDGGLATEAKLGSPMVVEVAANGNLYIVDNNRIRRVDSRGVISTVAGNGDWGYSTDGTLATDARLAHPRGLAMSPDGSLYFADWESHRVRRIETSGVQTVGGTIPIASKNGRRLYIFDTTGRHLGTQNTITGETLYTFNYNTDGTLASVTDGDGNVTTIERNATGQATAIVAPDGQRTEFTINGNGFLTTIINPAGNTWSMGYTDDGLLTSFETPNGRTNSFVYNENGRLIEDNAPNGGGWQITRTSIENGYRTDMTSGEGLTSSFTVVNDALGERLYLNQAPDGTVTERIHTDSTTTVMHPDGTVVARKEGPDPRFGMAAPVPVETTVTTPGGLTATTTVERTAILEDENNPLSHTTLKETATVNSRTSTATYDAATRTWQTTSAAGRSRTSVIDAQGRPVYQVTPGLAPLTYSYDARGRLTDINVGEGDNQRSSHMTYDSSGNLASVTDPLERTVTYSYDLAGRVTKQTFPDGRSVGYQYDANGNLTAITPPGREAHVFSYTNVDLEESYTPPDIEGAQTVTAYEYNKDKKLTAIKRPDGRTVQFTYDFGGRLAELSIERGTYQYAYDATTGQRRQITAPDGGTLSYTYDGFLPLSQTWSGAINGSVTRRYDNNFWLTERCVNQTSCASFAYDDDGLLRQAGLLTLGRHAQHGLVTDTTLGSIETLRSYNSFGEIMDHSATQSSTPLSHFSYSRDGVGRVTQKTETVGTNTVSETYSYDDAGRLTSATRNGVMTTWQYDANGNRTHENGSAIATYDSQDRLVTYKGASYSYTANGELRSKTESGATTTYNYDELGNLISATLPGDITIDYLIDGQNRRIGIKVNGQLVQGFLYADQLNPIAELDANGAIKTRFVYGSKAHVPDYMIKGGVTYRIISNHLGSPRLVVNTETGEVAQEMEYDVWGNILYDSNPGFQPFGFAGGIYDQHTGLVRFGARDYDPETGRWTAKDPIGFEGVSANLYGYTFNDPVNMIDPPGLESMSADFYSGVGGGLTVGRNSKTGRWFVTGRLGFGFGGGVGIKPNDDGPASQLRKQHPYGEFCPSLNAPSTGTSVGGFGGIGAGAGPFNVAYGGGGGYNFDGTGTSYGGDFKASSNFNPFSATQGLTIGGAVGISVSGWW